MTDLVTGATGFIGAHVLYQLVCKKGKARALYRNRDRIGVTEKIFGYYETDAPEAMKQVEWVPGDVTDLPGLMEVTRDVSCVYHVAGRVTFSKRERKDADLVNIGGTANIVNACLENGVQRLCHVSSIAVLGDAENGGMIDETVLNRPAASHSYYGKGKYLGEMEVWRGICEGLEAVIVNPSVVIGPGFWLGAGAPLFTRVYRGLSFYPGGQCGYVDVRDVASFMIRLAESDISGKRFILSAENLSHRDFINLVADAMGKKRPVYRVTRAAGTAACLVEKLRSWVTGQAPSLYRHALKIAEEKTSYDNRKVLDAVGGSFVSIQDSVSDAVQLFLSEMGDR